MQRLDLNPLVALDALLTERSITLAAEKLFLSPSATSGALARLQGEAPGVSVELLSNAAQPWEAMTRGEVDFLVLPKNFIHEDHPADLLFEDE